MAGTQTDNIQILDADGTIRGLEATDDLVVSASLLVNNNVTVNGNLVAKKVTSIQTEELRVNDNHIFLNDGYTAAVAQTTGIVGNYLPIALTDTVAAGGFTAGVPAGVNPTVATVGAATYSVGQFIMITGATDEANNGFYEVLSHAANVLTVRGVGSTATVEDFMEQQFTADTTVAGSITQVTLSVLRAGTDGAWEAGSGSSSGISFTDFALGGSTTLQDAYDNDVDGSNVLITTDATDGALIIAGTEKLQVTATGGLDVDTLADFDVSTFDVLASSAISLDASVASNFSVAGANLTVETTTSGTLLLSAAGLLDINAAANMDVDVTGTYDLLASGTGSLDFTGNSNVSATSGNMTISSLIAGNVVLNAIDDIDIDGDTVFIDALEGFSIDGATSSNATVSGSDAGALNLTISAVNAGAGTGNVLIAGDDEIDLTTVLVDVNATTLDIDTSGVTTINSVGASTWSNDSGNLVLETTTSGSLNLTSAGDSTVTVPNGSATAWSLTDGTDTYAVVNSVTNCLEIQSCLVFLTPPAIQLVTDATLAEGDLVYIKANGNVALADADAGTLREGSVIAASTGAYVATNTAEVNSLHGTLVPVRFAVTPGAADNGKEVFLSTTAGQATLTAPVGSGDVTMFLGILQGGNGADATPNVLWVPSMRRRGPTVTVP